MIDDIKQKWYDVYTFLYIKKEDYIMTQFYQQPYQQPQQPQGGKGLAITSMVLGIVSVVFFWIPYVDILTLLLGITALILGIVAGKKGKNGMAIAGLVLGIIGTVLSLISFITCVACAGCYYCQAMDAIDSLYYYY
jgi:hypothetical protein